MPGRDGTQLAAELRLRTPAPAIVFVTAHAEHALKAFDLEAVDYLTKPVKRERLQAALRRVAQRLGAPPAARAAASAEDEGPVIVVSDRGRIIRVPVADVLYLKAELKYVTLRTAEHTHVLDDSLAELESASATASCACTATRWSRGAPCARSSGARSPARTPTRASKAGASASRRSTNGSRCRVARSRRCARRWSRPSASADRRRATRGSRPRASRRDRDNRAWTGRRLCRTMSPS